MNITEIRHGLNEFFHKYLPFFANLHCVVINSGNVAARICIMVISSLLFHYSRAILIPILLVKIRFLRDTDKEVFYL